MSAERKVEIMGVPYIFARQKLKKPYHLEVITLVQQPVLCHNGCGLYYIPSEDQIERTPHLIAGSVCPDCHAPPKTWRTGAHEEIEVKVAMAFGNVKDVSFLRAIGPVSRRVVNMPISNALVTPPKT